MPYKVYKVGDKWCVHKKNSDGSRGDKIGCHDSREAATRQMRAVYANEGKEVVMPDEELDVLEEHEEHEEVNTKERIEKGYVPWGVTSFSDLKDARKAAEAAEKTYDMLSDYTGIVSNILSSDVVEDKSKAVMAVTDELSSLLKKGDNMDEDDEDEYKDTPRWQKTADKVIDWMKDFFISKEDGGDKERDNQFMIWKEADGRLRWFATYSNKFRDEDRPQPEIISEKSHIRFERLVDEKQVSMPELWLWHVPDWKFGVADWVAYDTEGFALASGKIDEGKEAVAEWISKQQDVAVSHGMPVDSIIRDPDDPTIIVGHVTREISALPYSAAANKLTDFFVLGDNKNTKQEEVMSISSDKKKKLLENWKDAPPNILEQLEASNAGKAKQAEEAGVEFKETEAEVENTEATELEGVTSETTEPTEQAETQPEAEESEAQVENNDEVQPEFPTREEVVEAITPMAKQIAMLEGQMAQVLEAVKELKSEDEAKIAKAVSESPPASVAAMISKNLSIVGNEDASITEDDDLAKSKPTEAKAGEITGLEWIDSILVGEKN